METPLFFKNKDYNLFGVLHEPEPNQPNKLSQPNQPNQPGQLSQQQVGVVFCHPFAEEKLISHRVMVNLARKLTAHGLTCLRFDEMGHGDSEGNFEDSTIETRLSDIRCTVDFLCENTGVERVCLLGVRFGATLAALACAYNTKIDSLILISPIVEGRSYIEQCLRSNLTTQMMTYKKIIKDRNQLVNDLLEGQLVNIDGYLINKDLYQQMADINLLNNNLAFPPNILAIQVSSKDNQTFEKNIEALYMKYKSMNGHADLLHVREDYFWKESKKYEPGKKHLEDTVANWLMKVYLP